MSRTHVTVAHGSRGGGGEGERVRIVFLSGNVLPGPEIQIFRSKYTISNTLQISISNCIPHFRPCEVRQVQQPLIRFTMITVRDTMTPQPMRDSMTVAR